MTPGEMQDAEQVDRGDVATKLNSFAALKVMSPTDLNQLADKIIVRPFKVGDRLQEAQSSGDFLYLVESGTLRETGKDSAGTVWWERTHTAGVIFSRQATYDGQYEETEVRALEKSHLYVIAPSDLGWAMTRQPALRQAVADLFTLAKTVPTMSVDGDATPDFDGSRIFFVGQSLGSIVGLNFVTLEPTVSTAVLSVPGVGVGEVRRRWNSTAKVAGLPRSSSRSERSCSFSACRSS